jgi:cytoskeletal protein CcmA (bactofilin family)
VEDVVVKTYLPVNDLQTCGKITVAKNGRVVAKVIRAGDGIECEGVLEGAIQTDGDLALGPKASWKGKTLHSRTLHIADGAKLQGYIKVPCDGLLAGVDKKVEKKVEQNADTNLSTA